MTIKRSDLGEYWAGLASGVMVGVMVGAALTVFIWAIDGSTFSKSEQAIEKLTADGAQCAEDFNAVSITLAHCWHDLRAAKLACEVEQ
jgi:hypothetical protein